MTESLRQSPGALGKRPRVAAGIGGEIGLGGLKAERPQGLARGVFAIRERQQRVSRVGFLDGLHQQDDRHPSAHRGCMLPQ